MTHEDKRLQRLQVLDDHIGRALRDIEARGELAAAPSWGKPLDFGDGYDETPAELRMPYKVLKDAGMLPPEVELMRTLAGLRRDLEATGDDAERARQIKGRIAAMQLAIELRRDALRNERRRPRGGL